MAKASGKPQNTDKSAGRPLDGIVVLDFSQFLAGPSCALRLADLGANVIKVERPNGGDACRGLRLADQSFDGSSTLFHTINRNKRSFAANLKDPRDLGRIKRLIGHADVMIHNFRPGVMERLGLDYPTLAATHKRLIYAAISGYGETGPWRDKPGQDLLVQALSGMTWLSGDKAQGPVPIGISVADIAAGANLCQGILAALLRRERTGRGGQVDVSLLETALDLQFELFTAFLNSEGTQPARGATGSANVYLPAPYGVYATADGHLALAMVPPPKLGALIGCEDLAAFSDSRSWLAEREAIADIVAAKLKTNPTDYWLRLLEPHDIWAARVLAWPQLLEESGYSALEATQSVHGAAGSMTTTRCPIRIDGKLLLSDRPAPRLGADTEAVAEEFGLEREAP